MAKISETYIRQAFLTRFARMGRESQNAVIEAMETIRDGTNPEDEPMVMACCGKTTEEGHSKTCKEYPPERIAFLHGKQPAVPAVPLLDGLEVKP